MSIPQGATDVFCDGLGFVRLVDYVGDELAIVNAARVSFHGESEWEYEKEEISFDNEYAPRTIDTHKRLSDKDRGLIKFLLREKHGSPFEQGFMSQWHIRLPIFVMREWVRHRIGFSTNEESGRYVQMRPDFYIPDHIRTQHGKPGAYYFEKSDDKRAYKKFERHLINSSESSYEYYQAALDQGIAKEQARLFLPLNLYTEIRWTANARSLLNFLALRNESHAMYEIKAYAQVVENIFKRYMPTVHEAFVNAERTAP